MLNVFTDTLVGISLCNGIQSVYIPINHKSAIYGTKVPGQLEEQVIKDVFSEIFKTRKFKWVFHNAKFDIAVLRTFFNYPIPDPYWDTMIVGQLLNQNEDHGLKYLYNKYIAEEDEGVNRFLIKSSYIVIYRKINKVNQSIIGCVTKKLC